MMVIRNFVLSLLVIAGLSLSGAPAGAVSVLFTGNAALGGADQGIIGHDAVSAGSIGHMSAFYGSVSIATVYTALATPDSYDFTTGGELAIGANLPGRSFGATAPGSAALASLGINGDLHLGIRGFSLNVASLADLSFSGLTENRIYRGGEAKIFEETAPNVFAEVAAYTNGIFTIGIDYSTGIITNTFTGTLSPGSLTIFPETWTGTSFNPINVAGGTPEQYGAFSVTTSIEISEQVALPEPAMPAVLGLGMLMLARLRRRR